MAFNVNDVATLSSYSAIEVRPLIAIFLKLSTN